MRKQRKLIVAGLSDFWQGTKVGEMLAGVIVGRERRESKFGPQPTVQIAKESNGEILTIGTSAVGLRPLNKLPDGAYVEVEVAERTKKEVGKKVVEVNKYVVRHEASQQYMADWALEIYAERAAYQAKMALTAAKKAKAKAVKKR